MTSVVHSALLRANATHYNYDLAGKEAVQLTHYALGGHYSWHCDLFWPPPNQAELPVSERTIRKLSICVQLSDPSSYGGGELIGQKANGHELARGDFSEDWRQQGSAVVFPSTFYHSITPVRFGARFSAVLWATGPTWR